MTDLADFLTKTLPRQVETEAAWHQGDLDARLAFWSEQGHRFPDMSPGFLRGGLHRRVAVYSRRAMSATPRASLSVSFCLHAAPCTHEEFDRRPHPFTENTPGWAGERLRSPRRPGRRSVR